MTDPITPERVTRAMHLPRSDLYLLDAACAPIKKAWKPLGIFLVGSCMERAGYRDVDVRMMLHDDEYARLTPHEWAMVSLATSVMLNVQTGLPVDFQVQGMTFANEKHGGKSRNSLGGRSMQDFWGDQGETP